MQRQVLAPPPRLLALPRPLAGRRLPNPTDEHARRNPAPRLLAISVLCWLIPAVALLLASHRAYAGPQPAAPAATRLVQTDSTEAAAVFDIPTSRAGLMMPSVSPDGTVWVAEMQSDRLLAFNPATSLMQEFAVPGKGDAGLMGLVADRQGRIWYAAQRRAAIGYLEPATGAFGEIPTPSLSSAPTGIALDAAGNVWFTEMSTGAIGELDVHSGRMREFAIPTAGSAPYWLAVDAQGNVWFTEFGAGKIGELIPTSGALHEWATVDADSHPAGLAIGPDGTVWFSESSLGILGRLTPSDGRLVESAIPARTHPYGLAVTADGAVWVSGMDGGLTRYAPASGVFEQVDLPTSGAEAYWLSAGSDHVLWVVEANPTANKLARLHN